MSLPTCMSKLVHGVSLLPYTHAQMKPLPVVAGQSEPHQGHVIKSPPKRKTTPPLASKNNRDERKERMREKREQQRLKKMAHSKLGEFSILTLRIARACTCTGILYIAET